MIALMQVLPPVRSISFSTNNQKANKFLDTGGGLAGDAPSIVAPGAGSLNSAGAAGSGSAFGPYDAHIDQQRQFEQMLRYVQISSKIQQPQNHSMIREQQKRSCKPVEIQNRVSRRSEEFSTDSNRLKSRQNRKMTTVKTI